MPQKILFIDRDGVLIDEPADEQIDAFEKFRLTRGCIAALQRLRDAGFGARTAIHPDQVAVIRGAFVPTPAEIDAARRIVEIHEQSLAEGRGVSVGDDGRMIDEAVVRSARRLLS